MSRTKKHPYIIANPHSWSGVANSVEGNSGGNGKGVRKKEILGVNETKQQVAKRLAWWGLFFLRARGGEP